MLIFFSQMISVHSVAGEYGASHQSPLDVYECVFVYALVTYNVSMQISNFNKYELVV